MIFSLSAAAVNRGASTKLGTRASFAAFADLPFAGRGSFAEFFPASQTFAADFPASQTFADFMRIRALPNERSGVCRSTLFNIQFAVASMIRMKYNDSPCRFRMHL